mmetsp:Transcript_22506/g.70535  ORF Transcript_22506/g.70535 Transcript_22506/m.70535 type:complete len:240 (+) Transcript_22506:1636-2355(+)
MNIPTTSPALSSDGRVVSGSRRGGPGLDDCLKLWDFTEGRSVRTLAQEDWWVQCAAVMSDDRVVTGSFGGILQLWDVVDEGRLLKTWVGHTVARGTPECCINNVAVLPDDRIISASSDNTLKVWDTTDGRCLHHLNGHEHLVYNVAVLLDGRAVSGDYDGKLKVWDLTDGRCLQTIVASTGYEIRAVTTLPDGRFITGGNESTLKIWDDCHRRREQRMALQVARQKASDDVATIIRRFL